MSLHFYESRENPESCLFELNDSDLSDLAFAFDEFEERFGFEVDLYGTTHLNVDNLIVLSESIPPNATIRRKYQKWYAFLNERINLGKGIVAFGD
jgi:hypothetical protein